MNIKINKIKEKNFKPFKIEIDIDCKEDAALIFLIFDNPDLKKSLNVLGKPEMERHQIYKIASEGFIYKQREKIIQYLYLYVFNDEEN
jgi:hypothetical protein